MRPEKGLAPVEPGVFVRNVLRDLDRIFEGGGLRFFREPKFLGDFAWNPDLEVYERDNRLFVTLDLPGLTKEEITIKIENEVLIIQGERKRETEVEKERWHRTERTYGKFVRTVALPEGVKGADIKAKFENGVLEIVVPLPAATLAAPPYEVPIAGFEEKKTVKPAA